MEGHASPLAPRVNAKRPFAGFAENSRQVSILAIVEFKFGERENLQAGIKPSHGPFLTTQQRQPMAKPQKIEPEFIAIDVPITFEKMLTTGSTLLDLAISGTKVRGGGLPKGIMIEVFGPESVGKTAIIGETIAAAQNKGGDAKVADPEGRFSVEYQKLFGMDLGEKQYTRPDTVWEMFDAYDEFRPADGGPVHVFACDSLAALSTEMEMKDRDKMGMKRAKDFSEGFRKYARRIADSDGIFLCSNQIREADGSITTPGGRAIRFYASLRIELKYGFPTSRVMRTRKVKIGGGKEKEHQLQVGIISLARVKKSSIDRPFREAPLYIEFDYGVDDVRANLQWLKDTTGDTRYGVGKATAQGLDKAIQKIEDGDFEDDLRNHVIDLWEELMESFEIDRKPKRR